MSESLQAIQRRFTRYLRDPENAPSPTDIEARRIEIYRDLFYSNIERFIASSFPVLRKIIKDQDWHKMIRDYFCHHTAHTPYFPKLAREFVYYLEHERRVEGDFPFITELAHYEWMETLILFDNRQITEQAINRKGNVLTGIPVLSPLVIPLRYDWPVHRISVNYLPTEPPADPSLLLIYRSRSHQHGFIELNPVSARLVELLQTQGTQTGYDLLTKIAGELDHPDPKVVIQGGEQIMHNFLQRDILLGTRQA